MCFSYLQGDDGISDRDNAASMKTFWPALNSNDNGRLQKDIELHCLMAEIDELMVDVGLTSGKKSKKTITYEEVSVFSG